MSATGLIMDGILILLLLAALMYGLRLEKKLKALREGQAGFAQAVSELNVAAGKAQAALADLRAASEETDLLHERIVAARTLKTELEGLIAKGRAAPAPPRKRPDATDRSMANGGSSAAEGVSPFGPRLPSG